MAECEQRVIVHLPADAAVAACQAACRDVGWKLIEQSPYRAVFKSGGMQLIGHPVTVEVLIESLPDRLQVRFRGSMYGVGPIMERKLRKEIERFSAALAVRAGAVEVAPMADTRIENQLARATGGWSAPVLIRQYRSNDLATANAEAAIMAARGYGVAGQSGEGGHLNLGTLVMTGGLGAAMGFGRTKGSVTMTFERRA